MTYAHNKPKIRRFRVPGTDIFYWGVQERDYGGFSQKTTPRGLLLRCWDFCERLNAKAAQ